MKNLLFITLILLFASCEKEVITTCSVCTATITTVSDDPISGFETTETKVYEELNTEESCELPHSDYEALITSQINTEISNNNALNPQTGINPVDWSVYQYSIVTTLNSLVCTEN
jgi:hypothetical protein